MTQQSNDQPLRFFVIAGEASGDLLGARLMEALRAKTEDKISFEGIGGPSMENEGLKSLFPMQELSLMGIAEVLPHIPKLLRRIKETVSAIEAAKPDAVITIDSPGFTFRVAKRLKGKGIPLIHYVAPTVWAWRPGRARKVAQFLDRLLVLLPFEPPYFEAEGLACDFVGHPVVERGADKGDGASFRKAHAIDAKVPLLCVLPGSRGGELKYLLPVFEQVVRRLHERHQDLRITIPTVPAQAERVSAAVADWPGNPVVISDHSAKFDCFAAADAALAASGTVALELAMAGTPNVVAYKVNGLTAAIARRLVRVRFANLVNIILDREVVPEFIQNNCTADKIEVALVRLLDNPDIRDIQTRAMQEAMAQLGYGKSSPGEKAAEAVLKTVRRTAPA